VIVVFPMNGVGQRFTDAGYKTPKALLSLGAEKMIRRVIRSYPEEAEFVFIVRPEMEKELKELLPMFSKIIVAKKDTKGPLETILNARIDTYVNLDDEIFIADCDSFFENKIELMRAVEDFNGVEADGGVTYRIMWDKDLYIPT